jgi:hypothetical protein
MLFTRKHDVNIPPLYMNDDVLEDVLKHKHLGIHFCPNGTWKDHINEIYKKAQIVSCYWKRHQQYH